jgi:hypothetical protein
MSANVCPDCQSELSWKDDGYYCEFCEHPVKKSVFCPDCEHEMEKLQACGSASYFCNFCNELKSKSRITIRFESVK